MQGLVAAKRPKHLLGHQCRNLLLVKYRSLLSPANKVCSELTESGGIEALRSFILRHRVFPDLVADIDVQKIEKQ